MINFAYVHFVLFRGFIIQIIQIYVPTLAQQKPSMDHVKLWNVRPFADVDHAKLDIAEIT